MSWTPIKPSSLPPDRGVQVNPANTGKTPNVTNDPGTAISSPNKIVNKSETSNIEQPNPQSNSRTTGIGAIKKKAAGEASEKLASRPKLERKEAFRSETKEGTEKEGTENKENVEKKQGLIGKFLAHREDKKTAKNEAKQELLAAQYEEQTKFDLLRQKNMSEREQFQKNLSGAKESMKEYCNSPEHLGNKQKMIDSGISFSAQTSKDWGNTVFITTVSNPNANDILSRYAPLGESLMYRRDADKVKWPEVEIHFIDLATGKDSKLEVNANELHFLDNDVKKRLGLVEIEQHEQQ